MQGGASKNIIRKAAKAGSWYESNAAKLQQELQSYLDKAERTIDLSNGGALKAIIGPHAGFAYSGPTAGWAYKNIDPTNYDRVVLLGPSHQLPFSQIGLTQCTEWATPFGNIPVEAQPSAELAVDTNNFTYLQKRHEENEHSLEMHLPFIKKVFDDANQPFTLVPMMVGQIKGNQLPGYGQALQKLFLDPRTLFVISSDFCHWGEHFDYQPVLQEYQGTNKIYQSIEALDKMGMDLIEKHDLSGFQKYLD